MNRTHVSDGPGAVPPGKATLTLPQMIAILAQLPDWRRRAEEVLQPFVRSDPTRAADRARLRAEQAQVTAELERLVRELPKMLSALEGGAPYRPMSQGHWMPKGAIPRCGLALCLLALVVLEASTFTNVYAVCVQILNNRLAAMLAATPLMVAPFSTKLLPLGGSRTRVGVAIASLVAAIAFVYALCRMVYNLDPSGVGPLLGLQACCDILGMVCVTTVMAKLTTPTPTEALREEFTVAEKRVDFLKSERERLDVHLKRLDDEEETGFQTAFAVVELDAAAIDAERAMVLRMREKNSDLKAALFPSDRN